MGNLSTYRPQPAALPLLGAIANLIPLATQVDQAFRSQPKVLAVLPGGQLFFDSVLELDTDGAPELTGDPTQQSDTSLHYRDRSPINANRVPYFVLPLPRSWPRQFGIALGDLAAVIFDGRIAFAAFADFGPEDLLGEGSVELFRRLGHERVRPDGKVRNVGMGPGIITMVFPRSGQPADRDNERSMLAAIDSRGPGLFQDLGGILPTT